MVFETRNVKGHNSINTLLCAVYLRSVGNARNRLLPRSIIEGKHIAHNALIDATQPKQIINESLNSKTEKIFTMTTKQRYNDAHKQWFSQAYPAAYRDGHYASPVFPKVATSNGLTRAIINFINWSGGNADRCNTVGRITKGFERQPSGTVLQVAKFIPSANRRGSADITITILGRSVKWGVKIGRDKPSEYQ